MNDNDLNNNPKLELKSKMVSFITDYYLDVKGLKLKDYTDNELIRDKLWNIINNLLEEIQNA